MVQQTFLKHSKHAPENLGRVLVLGLGRSGKAVVEYLLPLLGSRVESLAVAAGKRSPEAEDWATHAQAQGAAVAFDHEEITGAYDLCIASPGISQFSDFYRSAQAASTEVISEVEFAWRESADDALWVAITGTNGKTTTTALTAHLLSQAGLEAKAVGNIGDTCIDAVAAGNTHVYVAEVSSYQLASTVYFAPDVAIVLTITPDHLTWHKSFEAYEQAKWKVLENLGKNLGLGGSSRPDPVAILNATDDIIRARVRRLRALPDDERPYAYIPLGTAEGIRGDMRDTCGSVNAAFLSDQGTLRIAWNDRDIDLVGAEELQIKGEHNVANALAAASAALALDVDPDAIAEGLRGFAPLEHRIEPAGIIGGVVCYNDSKATNVDATLVALTAFKPKKPIVLLGGRDKLTDLAPLVEAARENCKAVVCFGESEDRFSEAFHQAQKTGDSLIVLKAAHLEDALDEALTVAEPGDILLLSPACASFDEFSCFEERGEVFKNLVAKRAASVDEAAEGGRP